jgi:hypothetical protein
MPVSTRIRLVVGITDVSYQAERPPKHANRLPLASSANEVLPNRRRLPLIDLPHNEEP